MSRADLDVLVVGAGPTGLALALQAHDHGAGVRVVERRPEPFRPSRALIVHPRTLEVLRPLGVVDDLLDRGDVSPSVRLHLGTREIPVELGRFDLPDTAFPHLLFVRQADVERVLVSALTERGIDVERGAAVVDVSDGAPRPHVTVQRGGDVEEVSPRYVAGCDGAASTVRAVTGVDWEGGSYAPEVVLADVEVDGDLAAGVAHVVAGRQGLVFLFAIGERATWRLLATRPAHGHDAASGGAERPVPADELQSLLDRAGLAARITDVAWSARVPLQHRIASHFRRGPLFLVGDAAHVHSPAGGQGMNTGIQDAMNLGWKLGFAAAGPVVPSPPSPLLDSYEEERRPVAQHVLAITRALFWAESGTDPLASIGRSALAPCAGAAVPLLMRQRWLVAQAVRTLSQLRVNYRGRTLSVEGTVRAHTGPRPGERLPDSVVTTAHGRFHVHELLAAPGIHLLVEAGAPGMEDGVFGRWVHVHHLSDRSGFGILAVRPDGYVGFRSASPETGQLASWLELAGVPRSGATAWERRGDA